MRPPAQTVLALAVLSLLGAAARAEDGGSARLFARLAGSWAGSGTVSVDNGAAERLRCRADYQPAGAARLHLALRCASAGYALQVEGDVTGEGDRVAGTWTEASYGVSGDLAGRVEGDRLAGTVSGLGLSVQLALALHGATQAVSLVSEGALASKAAIQLRRL